MAIGAERARYIDEAGRTNDWNREFDSDVVNIIRTSARADVEGSGCVFEVRVKAYADALNSELQRMEAEDATVFYDPR